MEGCLHVQFIGCGTIPVQAMRSIFRCIRKEKDLAECGFNVTAFWNEELQCFQVRLPTEVEKGGE